MEKKSILWAYGFLFFFGSFGVHRFYLAASAILYLLTSGLGGLGLVFDFFAMPFLVASANR